MIMPSLLEGDANTSLIWQSRISGGRFARLDSFPQDSGEDKQDSGEDDHVPPIQIVRETEGCSIYLGRRIIFRKTRVKVANPNC
jgi:hypothetical protein